MIGHEEWVPTAGSQLMDYRPQRGRAQIALGFGDVPELAPAEPQAERGVGAAFAAILLRSKVQFDSAP